MIEKINKLIIRISLFSLLLTTLFAGPVFATSIYGGSGPDLGATAPARVGLTSVDVRITTARLLRISLGLLGIIFVVIVMMGGYEWMTAAGNDQQIEHAKKRIVTGVVGLAIILSAYAISSFVISTITSAANSSGSTPGQIR